MLLRPEDALAALEPSRGVVEAERTELEMNKRYNSGNRDAALRRMAECAIRDREAMIDAMTPRFGELSKEDAAYVAECKAEIEDFRRIAKSTLNHSDRLG